MSMRVPLSAWLCVLLAGTGVVSAQDGLKSPIDFTRDIRPILSDNCFQCHGPDPGQREADLRLDTREGAFSEGETGTPFVPGKLNESEALHRLTSDDADLLMPPADSGKILTKEQIALLRRWVKEGAAWSKHWAFVPPKKAPLPQLKNAPQFESAIDAFVRARLAREKVTPSAKADKVTLLRRLSLDLVGIPPSIEEVDAFLRDARPDAYARQVERLLTSPHYGERWGRHWLDAARYADSDGFEKDKPRQVWFYRDWVINALNRDLPYDRFVVEQIAGDLLPKARQEQIVATGFLRNSMINEEGGVDPEQFRMEAMFDRMDAVGKAVLGLTIQCGQCHSHKYDPFSQDDYYRMFAFLNNSHESAVTVYTPEQQQLREHVLKQSWGVEKELKAQHLDWRQQLADWEQQVKRQPQPEWQVVSLTFDPKTIGGQKYLPQEDGSYLAQSYAPTKHRPRMNLQTNVQNITAIRLELLPDHNLPHGGPGRSPVGTCALTEFEATLSPADDPDNGKRTTKLKIVDATADVSIPERPLENTYDDRAKMKRVTGPIAFAIDGKPETAWGIDVGPGRRNQARKAVFRFEQPVSIAKGMLLSVYPSQKHGGWNSDDNQTNNIGRFRISVTTSPDAAADPLPRRVRGILDIPADQRTPAQQQELFGYWRTTVATWRPANERIEKLWIEHPAGTSQLVLKERKQRRKTHVLQRGDFLKPQQQVTPGFPDFLNPAPDDAAPTRLTFARWLVDRKAPTTARTIVNRVWQSYFGTGLVETSEDLGSQGTAPSHPELLDWLAVDFMEHGWSLKNLHRTIVTSATYQQSSNVTADLHARDPANRLLARGPRIRLEAEALRDTALAASGLLDRRIGGPSVYPPAPEFLFLPPTSYGPKIWNQDDRAGRYRRSLYTFRFRSVPYPALETFDAPNADFACVRRTRSNTPLQALTTLNETLFVECARALALRTVREGGANNDERLAFAFRQCVARKPSERESGVLLALLDKQIARHSDGKHDPWQLAADDPADPPKLPQGVAPAELAAWTVVARVLLNLDETITKE